MCLERILISTMIHTWRWFLASSLILSSLVYDLEKCMMRFFPLYPSFPPCFALVVKNNERVELIKRRLQGATNTHFEIQLATPPSPNLMANVDVLCLRSRVGAINS